MIVTEDLKETKIGINLIKSLYELYKEFFIHSGIILFCIILIAQFIIPQFNELSEIKKEEENTKGRIELLKKNINILSGINENVLNSQLQVSLSVLPFEKDFIGVLNAVSAAASGSFVNVSDFSFQVGDLSVSKTKTLPTLNLNLTVNGGVEGSKRFISELSKLIPISEIRNVEIGGNTTNLTLVFYYKPLPAVNFNYVNPIKQITPLEISTFNKISTWNIKTELLSPNLPNF